MVNRISLFLALGISAAVPYQSDAENSKSPLLEFTQATAQSSRAEEAWRLTESGSYPEAIRIYDQIITSSQGDKEIATQAVRCALRARDFRRAIGYSKTWLVHDPASFEFHQMLPFLAKQAGDEKVFAQERSDLLAAWQVAKTTRPTRSRSFPIETFPAGAYLVQATECYEVTGNFGVKYRFNVVQNNQLVSYVVLETGGIANKMQAEINKNATPGPSYSVDAFARNRHETVSFLQAEPTYDDMKKIVAAYIVSGKSLSSTTLPEGKVFAIDCEVK